MAEQVPGRARGRGRGRGRSRGAVPHEARRPGETVPPPVSGEGHLVGRGRGRAAVSAPAPAPQAAAQQRTAQVQPPTREMEQMRVNGAKGGPTTEPAREPRQGTGGPPRGRSFVEMEPHTRPEHIQDKRGTSGQSIAVISNFVALRSRPDHALYQYQVNYSPQLESKRLRIGLIASHEATLGKVRAFDGMILYLPHRLPQDETKILSTLQRDQTQVTITITLTNELHASSPICLQLFNIIFRRCGDVCV